MAPVDERTRESYYQGIRFLIFSPGCWLIIYHVGGRDGPRRGRRRVNVAKCAYSVWI